jgi:hypothetical protein
MPVMISASAEENVDSMNLILRGIIHASPAYYRLSAQDMKGLSASS